MTLKLYCYRDDVDRLGSGALGVTLYFAEDIQKYAILTAIADHVTPSRQAEVAQAIEKLVGKNAPVIQFVRMCIQAGTGKTQCYNDAKKAGISVRKQNQLALYDYLETEEEPVDEYEEEEEGQPDYGFFESVRQHFADEIEINSGGKLEYIPMPLSTCDVDDPGTTGAPIEARDFIFEIGDKESGRFRYWGHWKNNEWHTEPKIFDGFDLDGLETILRFR